MKVRVRQSVAGCLAILASLTVSAPAVFAQDSQTVRVVQNSNTYVSTAVFSQQEFDQMLAPIALYPDSLLTQILMAATYPLEVVQAARWSRGNPNLRGDQAVRAVARERWDPSVKSLVAFPQVLELMDESLDWTERLGDAFLSQEAQIWDTVQSLRQRADSAGNLQSNDQLRIEQDGPVYVIESARPDVIYIPYYDPLVVYGDWWWPGYAPMRWSPWSGYYARPGYARSYYWGNGIRVGSGFFFGGINWRQRHVNVINYNSFYYRNVNRRPNPDNRWQHDPDHRRGVPYRNPALREQFNRPSGHSDTRSDFRGRSPNTPNRVNNAPRGDRGDRGDRRGEPRPVQQGSNVLVPPVINATPRPAFSPSAVPNPVPNAPSTRDNNRRPLGEQSPQALEGVARGDDTRNASSRGQASAPRPSVVMPQRPAGNPPPPVQSQMQPQPRPPAQPQPQPQAQRNVPPPVQQAAPPEPREQRQAPATPNAPRERNREQQNN
ncbi:MAG: DUF3300 domain-containing protein [Burkholderiales bacterium]|nr:DUF3300 domain-containing protein [Burkholderiales bacterium]